MELVAKLITVAALAIFELWAAIPVGTALKLHPLFNGLASGLGAIIGVLLVVVIGDRLRNWLLRKKEQKKKGRIYKIWEKYGVIGLGLLAPLITGAPLGAAIGVSLGAPPKRLFYWMSTGIVIWTIVLVVISTLGFSFFEKMY